MNGLSRRVWLTIVATTLALTAMPTVATHAQNPPNASGNSDGSCTIHYRTRGDVRIDNGSTFHQQELRGGKTGTIYLPDRFYHCSNGHVSVVKQ